MAELTAADLLARALELEPAKRLSLATALFDSVEEAESDEWTEAWSAELDRRIDLMEGGADAGTPSDVVFERVRAKLVR
jgi:putative addiction module component (TIGR02574 family)